MVCGTFAVARDITEMYVIALLEQGNHFAAYRVISELSKDDFVPTCMHLMTMLQSVDAYHFVVQTLLSSTNA